MRWVIGCSGFHYREWKGVFYPDDLPQRRWFEYYASQFDTLELNTTFYRFPRLKTLQKWYDASPTGFIFSVKAPRLITHYKRFKDSQSLLHDFYFTSREGLQEKLGPVLFQFPPNMFFTEEMLFGIIEALDPSFLNVVEFRHVSWWSLTVYTELAKRNIIFSGTSHPSLPQTVIAGQPDAYYRFHGIPRIFYSAYTKKQLKSFADEMIQYPVLKQSYIYFNNTASTAAIRNAGWLKQYTNSLQLS